MINFKRFVSGILSLVMVMFMFESIPVYAKTGTETYTYEGYTVEYIVSNEWTGNQSVEVKITNTGEESILNWALKYDAKGEISGLWNAVSVSDEETVYLIKNSGYNYEIAPHGRVTFGYTLSGENLSVHEKFELCSKRVDTKEENYTAVLDITEEWDTGFKAELIVSNVSDSPLEAWRFSFDSNFTVSDIWDCRLLENTNGRYTVASEAWINPIQPGSSVTIGIVGIKEEGKTPEISGVTLSEVVIDDTLPEVQKPVGEMFIAAFGEYIKETETIDILWMSTQTEGTFEILMSDDNEEYTVAGSVQNADNYSIPADFVKKYIKVRQTNGNQTAESEPFVVMMTPTGYTVDFIDSDNDGLYDYIEDAVGTDKNLSDTDNDDLTDYEEVYLLGTDPVVYDSIVSGTSDGDADPDNDGLSNRYELDNGTNPLCDDTDSDGLTDGEEIGNYGTDPVKYDTDEDNIGDGDEITLGLNPLDYSTDGTPDNERIFEQKITSDSDIMSHINTEDNAFSMSIDISAAGNAENSISVSESGYSAVIQSDAVLGTIPEISYASGLSVEEVRVNFEIKDEYLENTLGTYSDCEELSGIKRLNIFRYFEEENILLPVETKFDIENNMVYTDVDMVGTYCLIDMEKWFESIGVSEDNSVSETEEYVSVSEEIETYENTPALMSLDVENKFIEIYYHAFYHTSISESGLPELRKLIKKNYGWELSREDYHFYFINTNGEYVTTDSGKEYAETIEELEEILNNITPEDIRSDVTDEMLLEYLNSEDRHRNAINYLEQYMTATNSPALSVLEDRARIRTSGYGYSHDPKIVSAGYDVVMYDSSYYENYIKRYINRQEIIMKLNLDSSELIPEGEKPLQIITATGLEPLPYDFKTPIKNDDTDYDEDGLSDWEEFDTELYKLVTGKTSDFNIITAYDLPTMSQMKDYVRNKNGDEFDEMKDRLDNAISRFANNTSSPNSIKSDFESIRILPIKSDPTKIDGDGDGIVDYITYFDSEQYQHYGIGKDIYQITEFDDPNPLVYEYLWQWPVVYDNGDKCVNLQSSFIEKRNPVHKAIDISTGKLGVSVIASVDGIVTYSSKEYRVWCDDCFGPKIGCSCNGSYGNYIDIMSIIDGKIYLTRYAHLSEINVKSGMEVNAGDEIGKVGSSGSSSGYHLDFSISPIGRSDKEYCTKEMIQENIGLQLTPNIFIDPILFDKYLIVNKQKNVYEQYDKNYNMIMSIPTQLINTCGNGYSCDDCHQYFDCVQYRKNLGLTEKEYMCNKNCIICKYKFKEINK